MKISLSKAGKHLVFTEVNFKDGIQDGEQTIGVLAIEDPAKASATLAKALKLKWAWGEKDENSGFTQVIRK